MRGAGVKGLRRVLLAAAAVFWVLHFRHLTADFPNNSPWNDWSKYTDEGWYGDAAIRHAVLGHWYLPGDFNPGVVMPVLPLLEAVVFHFTGVSLGAARALSVVFFGILLAAVYRLLDGCEAPQSEASCGPLAAPIAALLLAASPFLYAFDRLAILEPLLCAAAVLSLLTARHLHVAPLRRVSFGGALRAVLLSALLGLLLVTMVLIKPTALALLPAFVPILWARAGRRLGTALAMAVPPALIAAGLWCTYYLLIVSPRYQNDYQYLFAANAYTGFQLEPLSQVLYHTVADGAWMGTALYLTFWLAMAVFAVVLQQFFRRPLVQAFLLWIGGYFILLAYHNNLQPRYYLLLAVPMTALTAMALDEIRPIAARRPRLRVAVYAFVTLSVLAILVPDGYQQLNFVLHPEYTFQAAAQSIARIVRNDTTRSHLLLSVSGSDLTLMTGLPSIDDDFGTLDLDERVRLYHPGWYVAWNQIDDDKMDALQPLYRPVRVAAFPALDDPDRNLLILYRLDPARSPESTHRPSRRIPRALRTRIGQQPTAQQLEH